MEKKPQERSEANGPGVFTPSTAAPRLPPPPPPSCCPDRAKSCCGILDATDT